MIFSQKNISKFFVKVFFPRVLISLIITIGFTTLQSPAWAADGDLDTSFSGDGKLTTAIGSGNDSANSAVFKVMTKLLSQDPHTTDLMMILRWLGITLMVH